MDIGNIGALGLSKIDIKSESKKQDKFKNWPLIKDLQFLFYLHETWLK